MGHLVDGIVRRVRAASGLSVSNRRREPRACLVSGRTSPNSSGFCMYVFSNVTLSPTGTTGSSSPIALALFPFGVSRGRRACRDGDGRGRSGGPRSAARGEPRSAGHARRGTRRRARRSAGAEGESTEASKSPRNLCEKTRIRGLLNRGSSRPRSSSSTHRQRSRRVANKRHNNESAHATRPARGEARVFLSDRSGAWRDPSACPRSASRARSPVRR